MALFESYERREPQILACLKESGISSIEECKDITMAAGIDVYKLIEGIQPICFENAKWAYTVGAAIAIKNICLSSIAPSISSFGTSAATESTTITSTADERTNSSVISSACSPVSG